MALHTHSLDTVTYKLQWGPFLWHGLPEKTNPTHQKLPRLARLRVRTPSTGVASSTAGDDVFKTAFMFSCSAASSA